MISDTFRIVRETVLATPGCPDGPAEGHPCASCLASSIEEALGMGAARERHPAGKRRRPEEFVNADGQLDILQAVCSHVWDNLEADSRCQLCWIEYADFVEVTR